METIKPKQIWKNKISNNEIEILKNLGKGKWWVKGRMGEFKIRENMIHDNYTKEEGHNG